MKEGFPKNLFRKWNRKLKKEGMPERIRREVIPIPISNREVLFGLVPEIKPVTMHNFIALQSDTQEGIIEYIKRERQAGIEKKDILARLNNLIEESRKFELINETDAISDKNHKPRISLQDRERVEAEEFATGRTEPEEN